MMYQVILIVVCFRAPMWFSHALPVSTSRYLNFAWDFEQTTMSSKPTTTIDYDLADLDEFGNDPGIYDVAGSPDAMNLADDTDQGFVNKLDFDTGQSLFESGFTFTPMVSKSRMKNGGISDEIPENALAHSEGGPSDEGVNPYFNKKLTANINAPNNNNKDNVNQYNENEDDMYNGSVNQMKQSFQGPLSKDNTKLAPELSYNNKTVNNNFQKLTSENKNRTIDDQSGSQAISRTNVTVDMNKEQSNMPSYNSANFMDNTNEEIVNDVAELADSPGSLGKLSGGYPYESNTDVDTAQKEKVSRNDNYGRMKTGHAVNADTSNSMRSSEWTPDTDLQTTLIGNQSQTPPAEHGPESRLDQGGHQSKLYKNELNFISNENRIQSEEDLHRTFSNGNTQQSTSIGNGSMSKLDEFGSLLNSDEYRTQTNSDEKGSQSTSDEREQQSTSNENGLVSDENESQSTSDENGTRTTSDENSSQSTSDEHSSQSTSDGNGSRTTSDEHSSQSTSDEIGSQSTPDESRSRITSDEGQPQIILDEHSSQSTSDEIGSKSTSDENGRQSTSNENGSPSTSDENGIQLTYDVNGSGSTSDENLLYAISDENGSKANADENGLQLISEENGSQTTSDDNGSQSTSDKNGSETTSDDNLSHSTSDENGSKSISDGNGSQSASDENGPQSTSDENGSQSTSEENGVQTASDENGPQSTSDENGSQSTSDENGMPLTSNEYHLVQKKKSTSSFETEDNDYDSDYFIDNRASTQEWNKRINKAADDDDDEHSAKLSSQPSHDLALCFTSNDYDHKYCSLLRSLYSVCKVQFKVECVSRFTESAHKTHAISSKFKSSSPPDTSVSSDSFENLHSNSLGSTASNEYIGISSKTSSMSVEDIENLSASFEKSRSIFEIISIIRDACSSICAIAENSLRGGNMENIRDGDSSDSSDEEDDFNDIDKEVIMESDEILDGQSTNFSYVSTEDSIERPSTSLDNGNSASSASFRDYSLETISVEQSQDDNLASIAVVDSIHSADSSGDVSFDYTNDASENTSDQSN